MFLAETVETGTKNRCVIEAMQGLCSLLAEVSHDEAKMRERRETLSFLSFLPRRERPLLAGKFCEESLGKIKFRACPKRVGPRILSLESADYFGASEHD